MENKLYSKNSTRGFTRWMIYTTIVMLCLFTVNVSAQSSANYSFTTNATGSLALDMNSNAIDMTTGTTTLIAGGTDDSPSSIASIPFNFVLMGTSFSQFYVTSNGLMTLGSSAPSGTDYSISGGTAANPKLGALVGDLYTGAAGKVHYKIVGSAPSRCLVVEYNTMAITYSTSAINATSTYQVRLYESTGAVEFVYGTMERTAGTIGGDVCTIGFSTGSVINTSAAITSSSLTVSNTATFNSNTYTVSSGAIPNLNSAADGSRRVIRLIPASPADPTGLNFTSTSATGTTLNWTDNATNETGYQIYRSTDNVNFFLISTAAANAISSVQSGLSVNTTYYWRVFAITAEGGRSANAATGSMTTSAGTFNDGGDGIITVGTGGDYNNLTTAFAAINAAGLTANLDIQMITGYPAAPETYPIQSSSAGAAGSFNIKVYPTVSALTITSSSSTGTLNLNGAGNLTFDGRVNQTGAISLLIENTNVGGYAILFNNDASSNTIKYCTIKSVETSATNGTIAFTAGVLTGNDNNTIDHCDINDGATTPTNGIYSAGSSASVDNSGNTVTFCNISNYFSATLASSGILLTGTGNSAWTITSNRLFQGTTRTYTSGNTHNGIAALSGSGYTISSNTIGYANVGGTGTTNMVGNSVALTGFPGSYTATGTATTTRYIAINGAFTAGGTVSNIQGNTIAGFALYTSSGASTSNGIWCGINVTSGSSNIGTTTSNTIGATSGQGSIYTLCSTSGGTAVGIFVNGANAHTIQNNDIGAFDAMGNTTSNSGAFVGIDAGSGAGNITISSNRIGNTSADNIRVGYSNISGSLSNAGTLASTSASAATSFMIGIRSASTGNVIAASSNTLRGWVGSGANTTPTGITLSGTLTGTTPSVTANSNLIGTSGLGWIRFAFANAGTLTGLSVTNTVATTHSVQTNDVQGIVYSVAGTGSNTYINVTGATAASNVATISDNTFTNLNVNTTGSVTFISHSYTVASNGTQTLNNNRIVTAFNKGGAGGTVTGLASALSSATGAICNHTNNNFSNITVTGATSIIGINNNDGSSSGATRTVTGNTFNAWSGGASMTGMIYNYFGGASTVNTNTITNISGTGTIVGINIGSGGNLANPLTIGPNTITGLSSTTSTGGNVTGITFANTSPVVNINNNTINTLSSTGNLATITGLLISNGTLVNNSGNAITSLSSTGISGVINGVTVSGGTTINITSDNISGLTGSATTSLGTAAGILVSGGTTVNLDKNKICDISETGTVTSNVPAVFGINMIGGGTAPTVTASNNLIGDLRTPAYTDGDAIRGISVTSATAASNYNIYFNTIYLSSTSSGGTFGTTGIYHTSSATATIAALTLKNNIVVNGSTPAGAGIVSVLRRSAPGAQLTNYSTTSNNNFYYAGTPGASNAILNDNGTVYGTAGAGFAFGPAGTANTFQNIVAPREGSSLSESAFTAGTYFQGTSCSTPSTFLHLQNALASQIESGGTPIAGITADFDGNTRNNPPDIGADEFSGISPAPFIVAGPLTPSGGQCAAVAHDISVNVTAPSSNITSVTISYNNGAAAGPISMNNIPINSSTWTYQIPAASPTGTTVTWSITATNSLGLSTTYIGTSYADDPLSIYSASASPTATTSCSGSPISLTATFGAALPTGYCAASASSTTEDDIGQLTIADINNPAVRPTPQQSNPTAVNTYTDYSSIIGHMAPGGTYPVTIYHIHGGTDVSANTASIYIDFNHDGTFNQANEVFPLTKTGVFLNDFTGTVTVPSGTAVIGRTKMRAILIEGSSITTICGTVGTWGEVEDYLVDILPAFTSGPTYAWTGTVDGAVGTNNPQTVTPAVTQNYTAGVTFTLNGCTKTITSSAATVTIDNSAPTTQATNITAGGGSLSLPISWTNGNGHARVVLMNTTNTFTSPTGSPSANTVWANTGQQCIFNGTGNTVTVTGLSGGTTYWFRVYEYRCTLSPNYNTTTATGNPASFTTEAPLAFNVARLTSQTYTSIMQSSEGGNGSGIAYTYASSDYDGAVSNIIPIPGSNFTYQGYTVTGFRVTIDGEAGLETNGSSSSLAGFNYNNSLVLGSSRNVLAPFYEDQTLFYGGTTGGTTNLDKSMRYLISGSAPNRTITMEWSHMTYYNKPGPELYYQVVLEEATSKIYFKYGDMQLYNGTADLRWSYTIGMNGKTVTNPPSAGQVFAQQYENTTVFSDSNAVARSVGANGLAISPEPHSVLVFTPGSYTYPGSTPRSTDPPSNDDVNTPTDISVLPAFPTNISWDYVNGRSNLYSTRYATHSTDAPVCGGSSTGRDVWFIFNANNADAKVRVYGSGGFIPRLEVLDGNLAPLSPAQCVVGLQGFQAEAVLTGLTLGNDYFVRVYNNQTGTTATATATVSGGAVTAFTMGSTGSGYTICPSLFGYTNDNLTARITLSGGGGRDAQGNAVYSGGSITGINVSTDGAGSGYTTPPDVLIENPDWGITGEFSIIVFAKAANDDCAGAYPLTNLNNATCVNGQNSREGEVTAAASASTADGIPSCGTATDIDDDVWYKFTASATQTLVSITAHGSFNPAFQIWDGGTGDCSTKTTTTADCHAASSAVVTTVVGRTYFVRVWHIGAGSGGAGSFFDICVSTHLPNCIALPTSPVNGGNACSSGFTLSWPVSTDATGYYVYAGTGGVTTTLIATNSPNTNNTVVIPATPSGSYSWKVIPFNGLGQATGCATWSVTIVDPPTIGITPVGTPSYCAGSGGSVVLNASGATTYTWAPAGGLSGVNGSTVTANPASTTIYTVSGSLVAGCSAIATQTITVNPVPAPPVVAGYQMCTGGTIPGGQGLTATCVGTGGGNLNWYDQISGGTTIGATSPFNPIGTATLLTSNTPGTYPFYARCDDGGACQSASAIANLIIGNPLIITSATQSIPALHCAGAPDQFTVTVTGGGQPYKYSWSPTSGLSNATISNPVANPATTTTYTVTVTDNCLVTTSSTITVSVNPAPPSAITPSSASYCSSSPVSIPLTAAAGADSYSWSPTLGLDVTTGGNVVNATPPVTTTYVVTATYTGTGCTSTSSSTIFVGNPVIVTASANPSSICNGTSTQLNSSAVSVGGDNYSVISIPYVAPTPNSPTTIPAWTNTGSDDGSAGPIALPFSFTFYGNTYNQIYVGTNGYISFDNLSAFSGFDLRNVQTFPDPAGPNNLIALGMHDLEIVSPGNVQYWTSGTDFIIYYNQAFEFFSTESITGYIILHGANNTIDVLVDNSDLPFEITLGIENADGTLGTSPAGRNNDIWTVSTPEAWRFSPSAPPVFTYSWSPSTYLTNTTIANPIAQNVLAASTIYTVTVTDIVGGCSGTATATVTTQPLTDVAISAVNNSPASTYSFSVGSGSPLTLGTPTQLIGTSIDDGASTIQNIGFSFVYEGTTYTSFSVNSNELMKLGSPVITTENVADFTSTTNAPKFAPFWLDNETGSDGGVFYERQGSQGNYSLVVEWRHIIGYSGGVTTNTCQVVIYEATGVIEFRYGAGLDAQLIDGNLAGVGIGGATAANYLSVVTSLGGGVASNSVNTITNTSWPGNGTMYSFTPPTGPPTICVGGSKTLISSVTGGGQPYSYSWAPATGLSAVTGASVIASPASTTTYTLTVTDNCTNSRASNALTINVNSNPVVSVTSLQSPIRICGSGSVNLQASGADAYIWSPSAGLDNVNTSAVVASPTVTTTYTVVGISNLGCPSTPGSITVTYSLPLTATPTADVTTGCYPLLTTLHSGSAILGGGYDVTSIPYVAPTPNSPTTIPSWTPDGDDGSAGPISLPFSFNFYGVTYNQIYVGTNGYISFSDLSGETASALRSVTTFPTAATPNNRIALGLRDLEVISPGSVQYWTSGTDFVILFDQVNQFVSSNTITGYIILHSANNTIDVLVTNSNVTGSLTLGIENADGSLGTSPAGRNNAAWTVSTSEAWHFASATAGLTYAWTPSSNVNSSVAESPLTANLPVGSTTYTVTVTDPAGCTATGSVALTVLPSPPAPPIGALGATVFCAGGSVTLATPSLPNADFVSYSWAPAAGLNVVTGNVVVATPSVTTTYTATGYSANGCSASSTILVTVATPTTPAITPNGPLTFCTGQNVTLTAASGYSSYRWSPAAGLNTTSGAVVVASTAGTFTVTVTNGLGCTNTNTVVTAVNTPPTAAVVTLVGTIPICDNASGSVLLDATAGPGLTYLWNNQDAATTEDYTVLGNDNSFIFSGNPFYDFNVTVTDVNGCTAVSNTIHVTTTPCGIALNMKMYIQGFYNVSTGFMDGDPLNYPNSGCLNILYQNSLSTNSDPEDVDTVNISLMDEFAYTLVETQRGVLKRNGSISVTFTGPAVSGTNYWIQLKHRNLEETWSKNPIYFSSVTTYDFTTASTQAYDEGPLPMIEVAPGVWACFNGDIDQDGAVTSLDMTAEENDANLNAFGYYASDLDGDAGSTSLDMTIIENNANYGVFLADPLP